MKIKLNILFLIILSGFIFSDGDDCPNCYNPIADAGDAFTYQNNLGCNGSYAQICLDGNGSSDYENAMLTYQWFLYNVENSSGESFSSNIVFDDSQSSSPCFEAPFSNEDLYYTFKLIVNDGEYSSTPDFVTITVVAINTPPYFSTNIETSYSLKLNESFMLDLSSLSDSTLNGMTANGYNILEVDLSAFSSGFSIVDHSNYIYTLTAINQSSGEYSYNITISDGCEDLQSSIDVNIIENEPPYSIAGPNQDIWSGDSFTLDAG